MPLSAKTSDPLVALPVSIGPYRVIDVLGEGGMGVVYRADAPSGGGEVALKTVKFLHEGSVASIRSEIVALSRVRHPAVIRILHEGVHDGLPYYAMDLLEGRTLHDAIRELWRGSWHTPSVSVERETAPSTLGPESLGEMQTVPRAPAARISGAMGLSAVKPEVAAGKLKWALTLVRRLCPPLSYLHARGIIHRDLKPGNVFLRRDGSVVVMDFGLVSRSTGVVGREALEVGGLLVGTAAYMAPEQAQGHHVDARADLYALGIILYELLTGRVPFDGSNTKELLKRHVGEPPEPPSSIVDGVPERLESLVLRLLAKRPRDRIGYADDVAAELLALGAEDDPISETRTRTYLYRPELSGRGDQLATLEDAIRRLPQSRGSCFTLGGESGVGKTSLASGAGRIAALAGVTVITGECLPIAVTHGHDSSTRSDASHVSSALMATALDFKGAPLHPFRSLLRAIGDRCRAAPQRTEALFGPRIKVFAAYEPSLRDLAEADAHADPPHLSGEAAHERLIADLSATLAAFVADVGPLLLILDDLQWADELSLSVLTALADNFIQERALMVLGTYRSDEVEAPLAALLGRPSVRRIELGRLDEQTVGVIVRDMLALAKPPEGLVRFLAEQSEGNPFFVAEYLRLAVDEGLLYRKDGVFRFAGGADDGATYEALPLPRSLHELVMRRLHGLPEEQQQVLEVATVLGRDFDVELLCIAAEVPQDDATGRLKELAVRQVLQLGEESGHYRFVHDKLREIVYRRIPGERRRELHRVVATTIERRLENEGDLSLHYGALGHHWTEAGVASKAITYLERAGDKALEDFSNREAIAFFRRALSLAEKMSEPPGPLRLARWERGLVEAHQGLGEDAAGLEHATRALAHCGKPVPKSRLGRVLGLVWQIAVRVARSYVPARMIEAPLRRAMLLEAADVAQRMLEPAFRDNDPVLGTYVGLRSLNLAERVTPSAPLARGYAFMSMIVGITPLQSVARSWSSRALALAASLGSEGLEAYCLSRVGGYSLSVGRFSESSEHYARGIAIARRLGDRRQLEECLAMQALGLYASGQFKESLEMAQEHFGSGSLRGDAQTQAWARCNMGHALARLGRATEGRRVLEAGRAWFEKDAEMTEALMAETGAALSALLEGDLEVAREKADRALSRVRKNTPVQFYLGPACAELTEVHLALWEAAADAEVTRRRPRAEAARQACAVLTAFAKLVHFARPSAYRSRGLAAWLDGKPKLANSLWNKALAEAERLEMPYEKARAHFEIGRHLEGEGRDAHLDEALAIFTEIGATPDALATREEKRESAPRR